MLLLAIDTAGPDCAVALVRSGASGNAEIVARVSERIGRGHAERLMPTIEAALETARADFGDLERIAVTIGPGSFTGLRVGIAAARGLALALDVPAVGVVTLEALAHPAIRSGGGAGTVVASLDAKRGEVFLFAQDIESGVTVIPPSALRIDAIAGLLAETKTPWVLTGSGAPIVIQALDGHLARLLNANESPDILDVAALGLAADPGNPPTPLYLRGADAKPQAGKVLVRA